MSARTDLREMGRRKAPIYLANSENDLTIGRIVGMMVLYSSYGRNISKFGRSGEDVWYRATLRG